MRKAFSVSVFVVCNGRVLLIKHKLLNRWLPPGGELTNGETPAEGAYRKLREETGLAVQFEKTSRIEGVPAGFVTYEEHDAGPRGLHLNFVFAAFSETMEVVSDGSFDEYLWFEPLDILEMEDGETAQNVKDIVQILHDSIRDEAQALEGC